VTVLARTQAAVRTLLRGWQRRHVPESAYRVDKVALRAWLPEDPVIVEAGAHIGADTVEMATLWPRGRIFAFEPVPHVYAQLESATQALANVEVARCALGEADQQMPMWLSGGASDGSSSLRAPKEHIHEHPTVTFGATTDVPVMTLEHWARQRGLDRIDFLWLDMQGHELAALKAAGTILDTVSVIVLEVFLKELYEGAPLWPEVRAWLEDHCFRVEAELLPWPDSGNVVMVRRPAG
jgi:FkbM family methyltransferase